MRHSLLLALGLLLAPACSNAAPQDAETLASWEGVNFFELETHTLAGQPQKLAEFEGKLVLVVNTASKCGLTGQYAGLQELYDAYSDQGLVVMGFPCNQFLGQEPGSALEIASFCEENYGVTFPMMEKVNVKAGDDQSAIYGLLGTRTGELPDWNFSKYLVSRDGKDIRFFEARTAPLGDELKAAIEAGL